MVVETVAEWLLSQGYEQNLDLNYIYRKEIGQNFVSVVEMHDEFVTVGVYSSEYLNFKNLCAELPKGRTIPYSDPNLFDLILKP